MYTLSVNLYKLNDDKSHKFVPETRGPDKNDTRKLSLLWAGKKKDVVEEDHMPKPTDDERRCYLASELHPKFVTLWLMVWFVSY